MMAYDYECLKCKHRFEERREIKDRYKFAKCPKCEGNAKKIMSVIYFNERFVGATPKFHK